MSKILAPEMFARESIGANKIAKDKMEEQIDEVVKIASLGVPVIVEAVDDVFLAEEAFHLLRSKIKNRKEVFGEEINDLKEYENTIRNCINITSTDEFKVVEGQITQMNEFEIRLKTKDIESKFEMGKIIRDELEREKVCVGDVIKIYKETGFVKRVGRAMSFDSASATEEFVDVPRGECFKVETVKTTLTLHEIDELNQMGSEISINKCIKNDINAQVDRWIKEGKAVVEDLTILVRNAETLTQENFNNICSSTKIFGKTLGLVFICSKPVDFTGLKVKMGHFTEKEGKKCIQAYFTQNKIKANKLVIEKMQDLGCKNIRKALDFIDFVQTNNEISDEKFTKYMPLFFS